jgi:transcriptional regulator with XRE-family HTH domain
VILIVCRRIVIKGLGSTGGHSGQDFAAVRALLAALRHEQGLSQEELAHRSGLHRTYVGAVERGERNPTLITLAALAKGLRCSLGELVASLD